MSTTLSPPAPPTAYVINADEIAAVEDQIAGIGHNSGETKKGKKKTKAADISEADAARRLRSIVERIERLKEEQKALSEDIKEIGQEAQSAGFDVATIRQIIKLRAMDQAKLEEQDTLLDVYRRALGF
jgi:uncharacterized protein (UPF0335 family)